MKYILLTGFVFLYLLSISFRVAEDPKTLSLGSQAPDFKLPGIDGKTYSLASFKSYSMLVVIFTCNHCPTAQAYEDRLIQLAKDFSNKGVGFVAISPNDPDAVRLDELGYSDLSDSYEEMKIRAKQKGFNFPYLYDGETQGTSKAYGPIATPHIFIFDKARKLRYQGRIDELEKPGGNPKQNDTRNAIESLLNNKDPAPASTKVFGCSVKWADKKDWVKKGFEDWKKEKVEMELIDEKGIRDLVKNSSDKLRLINIWATWCGPCVIEFPTLINIYRMYRGRDFEFISISADNPSSKEKALKFLRNNQASSKNYLFNNEDKYKLIEAIDPNWQGALPYTLLVEPGGKIVYAKQGIIDPMEMKKLIVENRLIGRFY